MKKELWESASNAALESIYLMTTQNNKLTKMMNYTFIQFKSRLTYRLIITALFICAFGIGHSIYAQHNCPPPSLSGGAKPISQYIDVCVIIQTLQRNALRSDGSPIPLETKNKALINAIQKNSIKNFILEEEEEQWFREAGASDALIALIKKESAKLENTSTGKSLLGEKYLKIGIKYREEEEKFSKLAKEARIVRKNEEEALKHEEEAKKNDDEAQKNLDKAVSYFKQATDIEPNNIGAISNIGAAYAEAKKYDEAIAFFNQAIGIDQNVPARYIRRGNIYEKKGLAIPTTRMEERKAAFDKAIEDYTKALEIDPDRTDALKFRADVYKMWNRKEEEAADRKRITDIRNRISTSQ